MEEEEEDDLEISFKPSSMPTFLPFPPVDSSAHLLNALTAKVGTYSQIKTAFCSNFSSNCQIPSRTYCMWLLNVPTEKNRYFYLRVPLPIEPLTLAYQDLLTKHCLEVQIAKKWGNKCVKGSFCVQNIAKMKKFVFATVGSRSSDPYL